MTEERFLELLKLYKSDGLSREQKPEWQAALDSGEFRDLLSSEIEKDFREFGVHPSWSAELKGSLLGRIRVRAGMTGVEREIPAVVDAKHRRLTPFRWTVAASILALMTAGYFLINKKPAKATQQPVVQIKSNDAAPGTNKATLTLANGSKIILDNAADGTLAQQGNTKITKLNSGELAYNEQTEKPTDAANLTPAAIAYNTLSTPRGGKHELTLPDGTRVWLNAASSITYPVAFTGNKRKVVITGEAYFEVVHNELKPFSVDVNGTEVHDIGTHFNINAYSDEPQITTTLLEGSVKIIKGNANKILTPGQQAIIIATNANIKVKQDVDLDQVISWKNGLFQYENATVQEVLRQMSRWYDVDVVYETMPNVHLAGVMNRNTNLSQALELLRSNGVHCTVTDGKIIVQK